MVNRILAMIARIERRVLLGGAAGLAAFLLAYALVGFLVLPGVVKSKAEQLVLDKLHRPLSIEKVEVNPFSLSVTLHGVRMLELDKVTAFASVERAYLNLSSASLFRMAPVIKELRLTSPHVVLTRLASNRYNVDDLAALALQPKPDKEQSRFSLHNIQIEGGRIEFNDQPNKARHVVEDLRLGIPFLSSLPSQVDIFVEPLLSANINGTPLLVKGKARPFAEQKEVALDLQLDGIDLPRYMEYLPFEPRFKLPEGKLGVNLTLNFTQPKGGASAMLIEGGVSLRSLLLAELDGTPMLRLPEMNVSGIRANLSSGQHRIGRVDLVKPEIHLAKEAGGKFNLARLAPATTEMPAKEKKDKATSANTAGAPAIRIELDHVAIKDGGGSYQDEQSAQALKATADKLDLVIGKAFIDLGKRAVEVEQVSSTEAALTMMHGKLRTGRAGTSPTPARTGENDNAETGFGFRIGKLALGGWSVRIEDQSHERPAVTTASPVALTVTDLSTLTGSKGSLDLQATVNKSGILSAKGSIALEPVKVDLDLDLKDVDILAVQPYVADQINLVVKRANLSSKGALQIARGANGEMKGSFKGDVSLGDLITVDRVSGNDFVRWKRLSVTGVDARLSPLSLTASQMALNDFFARVIISREGRINLQDIARREAGKQKSLTEEDDEKTPAERTASAPEALAEPAVPAEPTTPAPATKMPPIRIGQFALKNGRVRFTDNFIQPNYSALLNNLSGTISDLSSDASTAAAVDVRGQVSGAPLTIEGKVNPLSGNLFLDIDASVKGMELAPLSAYSGKYAGYGIEKGKLSFDVSYQVEDRHLTAQNRLVLDQLELGDEVDSPNATKLPVRLALALLKDRNGVIDVNLPISGSLNDPQFSLGGIIVRAFVNLIVKAVTAPFSLLGAMFGGGEDLSWLEFESGSRTIPDAGKAKLESLAKALIDRPALQLEITGRFDPVADKEGLGRSSIQRKVRALKRADLEKQGKVAAATEVTVLPAEYPALLKRVYANEKFSKPRNLIGMQKSLPVEEMEGLMIANHRVSEDDMVALANQRAQWVKDWLTTKGEVPAERIFILAGKSGAGHKSAKAGRVDFSLR